MNEIVRTSVRPGWSDLVDWVEGLSPASFRAGPGSVAMRAEEFVQDGRYVLRVEAPGVDPAKDVEVTVEGDMLLIRVERREEVKEEKRSEFRYGSFERRAVLPVHVRTDDVTATYRDGILEVSVGMEEAKPESRHIPVQAA